MAEVPNNICVYILRLKKMNNICLVTFSINTAESTNVC